MLSIVILAAETANNNSEGKRRMFNVIRNVHTVSLIKLRDVTLPADIHCFTTAIDR